LRIWGDERTESMNQKVSEVALLKGYSERTKDIPALAEPLSVLRVDHICNSVAVVIVSVPD
jgi:hypothetical protein